MSVWLEISMRIFHYDYVCGCFFAVVDVGVFIIVYVGVVLQLFVWAVGGNCVSGSIVIIVFISGLVCRCFALFFYCFLLQISM